MLVDFMKMFLEIIINGFTVLWYSVKMTLGFDNNLDELYFFDNLNTMLSSYYSIVEVFTESTNTFFKNSNFFYLNEVLDYIQPIVGGLINLIDVLIILVPILLAVAFMTIIERKQLAAMQRRVGPNTVGYYGVLQPFSDALKLILKETVIPSQSNKALFYLAPVSTLIFSLLGYIWPN
jgi:hypothetical protein